MKPLLALIALILTVALPASAEQFPDRAIRIVVPYSAGGTSDTAARLAAEPLARLLGQSVYVENRPGAGGMIGTQAYFTLPPDGYILLVIAAGTVGIIPAAKPVSFVPERDLIPLGGIWLSPQLLAVRNSFGPKTVQEFVAYAKADPGKINIASAGNGTLTHMSGELFKREAGIELTHVPFRSTGDTQAALLGGQIDALFGDVAILLPQIQSGQIRPLAVAATKRSPLQPKLMTMVEAGFPGVVASNWFGLAVSSKTPAPVIEHLKSAVAKMQAEPTYQEALANRGVSAGDPGPEAFRAMVNGEIKQWRTLISASKIKID
jgi:tripartite-type tricarboxylate transporter receptor subunit TctC